MHTQQPSGSVLALRILVVCRRLVPSALFLHMLHIVGRVGCATPQRACFVSSFGRFAPCDRGRSRSVQPGDSGANAILPHRLPRTRALLAVSCNLQASFPNGLLASSPAGSEAGQRGVRMDGGADYVLDENSVHIWMVQTDHIEGRGEAFLETLQATLSEDEKQRYARSLATPRAREQALSFLVARALLHCTLSRYCPHVAPGCWRFEVNSYGRPSLSSQLQEELSRDQDNAALQAILQRLTKLRFNLSHCAGMVVCAFAYGREVGIDSENINGRRRIKSIAKRFFTPSETAALLSVPEEAQPLTFSRLWTLKEAYVKARGLGISGVGLDNFEFQLIDRLSCHRPTGSLAADLSKAGDTAADWQFVVLDPPRGVERGLAQTGEVTDGDGGDGSAAGQCRAARHTVALATSCFAMPPAQVSLFATIPLASEADEFVDLSRALVIASHATAAVDAAPTLGHGHEQLGDTTATQPEGLPRAPQTVPLEMHQEARHAGASRCEATEKDDGAGAGASSSLSPSSSPFSVPVPHFGRHV